MNEKQTKNYQNQLNTHFMINIFIDKQIHFTIYTQKSRRLRMQCVSISICGIQMSSYNTL